MLGMTRGPGIASVSLWVFSADPAQGRLFRKSGFGASLLMRLMMESLWHITGEWQLTGVWHSYRADNLDSQGLTRCSIGEGLFPVAEALFRGQ